MSFEKPGPVEAQLRDAISPIEEIIEEARQGRMFILVDHEDRENEGDLVIPAQHADAAAINFMATHGRGLICLTLPAERIEELGLPMMALHNSSRHETAFTVSIEAREGVSTGISAADRALTVATAIDPEKSAADIATPGHVFPLRARRGGVLVRAGHTEAGCDVARLAGHYPASVICEIMKEDGTMARLPDLVEYAQKHGLKIGTISDLITYRARNDNLVVETSRETVTSEFGGEWEMRLFTDQTHGIEHVVMIKGDITTPEPVLVRTHALHEATDILGLGPKSARQLPRAMEIIAEEGRGVVTLFRQPRNALYANEDEGPRTVTIKQTGIGAQILSGLGLHELVLLTDSPSTKYVGLDAYGLSITGSRPILKDA
ncbi:MULTISPECIES: 3,4-dihydroxy-2-butanone-4-phosphate synthase [Leisingera]|jgi:3,4-dihydroxy 2-butanone 4-phosphate synthase/GTP cyclohydrolase II|uniref:3,4-dihydroxy-2-butanone 4-phosphate synthase n=1 Tax=Leisingera aquaemixtae TaxID=1396826 RepID=A0A0P1H5Q1_9RHOB|nr:MULTISPECIES: 3,4-dihydroxy-2-butanone-4-phosphate synthase [Leisingera]QDI75190.1 3,4-dihydroxy-2-butanone-4-phosphate synthase [Leisingera aquaemixtae]UWQ23704.1 3,4-dihydroxy-2-butanone-4-phosphate synthase [Leisingera aquaemixtae]UWQ36228.1 3,4-dihydroxy-2-butanone-4-phosphate synthase [Leisingera aquaemixtae]UWQ40335.1 3,4-dihydroxy-2-butanone-4-phosphate synthase [Leisingera aquaemixtae]CUH98100.1 Riboflavin biosynthesis protein RibBA [Leisingera aquaemixtae]